MLFSDIPDHDKIKQRLILSVREERISHAQMFYGPEGSGSLALSLAYARYICCTNRGDRDACGVCPSCRKFDILAHPDLHFAFPTPPATKVEPEGMMESWRAALRDNPFMDQYYWYERIGMENSQGMIREKDSSEILRKLSLKSYESEYKILIMWLPELLNVTSANKLLKLIEEPPPGTLFLLVSEKPEYILPTIQSRTQMIKISKIGDDALRSALEVNQDIPGKVVENAVRLANGDMNKALGMIRADTQHKYNFEKFVSLMRLSFKKDIISLIAWVDEISGIGREKQKMFLSYCLRMVRENFMLNTGNKKVTHMAGYEDEFSVKFSAFIHPDNVASLYEEFNKAYNHISANGYARIVFLDLSLKILRLLRM